MNRAAIRVALILVAFAGLVSCNGGMGGGPSQQQTSGLSFRAFVSNPLQPARGGGGGPVLNIIDANKDVESAFAVGLSGISGPGLMAESPNLGFTLVYDSGSNAVSVVQNVREAPAVGPSGQNLPAIPLPGPTESMFVAADNGTGWVAIPTAPQNNPPASPGGVVAMSLSSATIAANIPVPSAHYVTGSHNANRVLAFQDNSTNVVVIAPSLIGSSNDPRTFVPGFDDPVWGVFSPDDTVAYIFNCGPECGGTAASVTVLNLATDTPVVTVPVPAASYGMLFGNTLYVAGTPPNTPCPSGTAVANCGVLTILDVSSGTPTIVNSSPIFITDGYHNRMELGANGRLFIGSKNCTSLVGARGCLSIYNTTTGAVVVPPAVGDVTGIAPVTGRNVVYVCQGGAFFPYDTTTDMPEALQTPITIIGMPVDVKIVDP